MNQRSAKKSLPFYSNPRHLLPLMLFTGLVIIGIRVDDLWVAVSSGTMFPSIARAETKPVADKPADAPAPAAAPSTPGPEAAKAAATAPVAPLVPSASMDDTDVSPAEMEVLKQLSDRRVELDRRARELDTRESLMKVTEQRVDQKIKEMETLRLQLQSMVNQVNETQATQIENLVKIYETMKPDEAARIFETLDMPILLGVIQRMKPARTAPIMAKMAPQKAKDLTIALTKQDQLPPIK